MGVDLHGMTVTRALSAALVLVVTVGAAGADGVRGEWCAQQGPIFFIDEFGVGWGDHSSCEAMPLPPQTGMSYVADLTCYSTHFTDPTAADGVTQLNTEVTEIVALLLPDGRLALYLDDGLGTDILSRCNP